MRRARSALGVAIALGVALAGCNLIFGITEEGLRIPEEAGVDAAPETAPPERPALEPCTRDTDCVAPNACYTPHCDTVVGACTYALCEAKGRTCAMGACNTDTFACSDPLPYTFRSTSYDLPSVTSGCGANPAACVAAAFPFVFIGTRDDVVAFRGDDLAGTKPNRVPITDLTVNPDQVIASGRRIWVLGSVQGEAPPYQLAIGTIDVPSDPTVKVIHAKTMLVSYPFPTVTGFPAPKGGLFLVHDEEAQGHPAALLQAPPAEGAKVGLASAADAGSFDGGFAPSAGAITMFRIASPPGSKVVASTGTRLVLHRYPSTFNLVQGAGTVSATAQVDLGLNPPVASIGSFTTFTQGPEGTVLMAAPIVADPAGDCGCSSNARMQWVFPNAVATMTDVNQVADVDGWNNPQVTGSVMCHQCALDYVRSRVLVTWIDPKTALTASPFSGQAATRVVTDLRVIGRDPVNGYPKRRAQTKATDTPKGDFATDRVALTSSNGIGYLVLADSQGNDVSLSIVDPRCEGP